MQDISEAEVKSLEQNNDPTNIPLSNFAEYKFVEYYTRMAFTQKIPVKILAVHSVKNSQNLNKLEEAGSYQWTYGWHQLSGNDYPSKIGAYKTRGFFEKSRQFMVSNVPAACLGPFSNDMYFLLCVVVIGNALAIKSDKVKDKKVNAGQLPAYYHSCKLLNPENMVVQLSTKGISSKKNFTFIYEIFQASFVVPLYVIKLRQMTELDYKKLNNYFCARCRQKEAEVFCLICEEYYDKDCYNLKHKPKGKADLNHGTYQTLSHKQRQGVCADHVGREAEYYCATCRKPICSKCKLTINNKPTLHASHSVKNLYAIYDEVNNSHFLASDLRKRALSQLAKIKQAVKALIEKQVMIEREIDHEFRGENDQIQALTKRAKLKHFSVVAALNEMKTHLNKMDGYFSKCQRSMMQLNLSAETVWVKDNYEHLIEDMYANFNRVNVEYKVSRDDFRRIKRTTLAITKKIDSEVRNVDVYEKIRNYYAHGEDLDRQYVMTKKIVSLKQEKEEAKKRKDREAQNAGRQDFVNANDPLKYVLEERSILRQKDLTLSEMKKVKSKEEDDDKKRKKNLAMSNLSNLKNLMFDYK